MPNDEPRADYLSSYVQGAVIALCSVLLRIIISDHDNPDKLDRNIEHTPGILVADRKRLIEIIPDATEQQGVIEVFDILKHMVEGVIKASESNPQVQLDADYLASLAELWEPQTFFDYLRDAYDRGSG